MAEDVVKEHLTASALAGSKRACLAEIADHAMHHAGVVDIEVMPVHPHAQVVKVFFADEAVRYFVVTVIESTDP